MALFYVQGVVMKVGDLVNSRYNQDIGIITEVFHGWRFRIVWSNGQSGVYNATSLEEICK